MKLLCTDLDRTLLPNGEEPESALARPLLWHLLDTHSISLAYVSGRDLDRVLDAIHEYKLRVPDIIVADVGSSLYLPGIEGWVNSKDWQSIIATDWNGLCGDDIKRQLRGIPELSEQESSRQSPLKASYYFPLNIDREKLHSQVSMRLESIKVKVALVLSDDVEKEVGLLDVLPQQASKSGAVHYIRNLLNIDIDETLFAGDSGNDVAALVSSVNAVAVANADADTQRSIVSEAGRRGTTECTYQAVGGLSVSGNRVLNGNYAAGILEGMIHYSPAWHEDLLDGDWVAAAEACYLQTNPLQSSQSA